MVNSFIVVALLIWCAECAPSSLQERFVKDRSLQDRRLGEKAPHYGEVEETIVDKQIQFLRLGRAASPSPARHIISPTASSERMAEQQATKSLNTDYQDDVPMMRFGRNVPDPPIRPEVFTSPEELRQYLKALNEYFAIVGRPRFR